MPLRLVTSPGEAPLDFEGGSPVDRLQGVHLPKPHANLDARLFMLGDKHVKLLIVGPLSKQGFGLFLLFWGEGGGSKERNVC